MPGLQAQGRYPVTSNKCRTEHQLQEALLNCRAELSAWEHNRLIHTAGRAPEGPRGHPYSHSKTLDYSFCLPLAHCIMGGGASVSLLKGT